MVYFKSLRNGPSLLEIRTLGWVSRCKLYLFRRRAGVLIFFCICAFINFFLFNAVEKNDFYNNSPYPWNHQPMKLPYGEQEVLRKGSSCFYNAAGGWLPALGRNPWTCRKCDEKGICRPLKRRGRCPPFRRREVDQTIPRIYSEWNPFTAQKSHTLVMHHDAHSEYAQRNTPQCSSTLSMPCFNLTRCLPSTEPIKVFPYGKVLEGQLDEIIEKMQIKGGKEFFQKAKTEEEACLLVIGGFSFEKPSDVIANPHWKDGQNHYVFMSSGIFDSHRDRPFNTKIHFGMAAVSQFCSDDAFTREGYDTPLSYLPKWKPPPSSRNSQEKRRLLLSFKGNIFSWEQHSWQHRWIASEYWKNDNDVHVDTKCRWHNYADTTPESYTELLLNSTFVFCPGGGGIGSFRFGEALRAGAIPVVTSDFTPPFHPDIDWSDCLVRVSETRVVDIPNILRNIDDSTIQKQQRRCATLYREVFGEIQDDNFELNLLSVSMRIWSIRIRNALRKQLEISDSIA